MLDHPAFCLIHRTLGFGPFVFFPFLAVVGVFGEGSAGDVVEYRRLEAPPKPCSGEKHFESDNGDRYAESDAGLERAPLEGIRLQYDWMAGGFYSPRYLAVGDYVRTPSTVKPTVWPASAWCHCGTWKDVACE